MLEARIAHSARISARGFRIKVTEYIPLCAPPPCAKSSDTFVATRAAKTIRPTEIFTLHLREQRSVSGFIAKIRIYVSKRTKSSVSHMYKRLFKTIPAREEDPRRLPSFLPPLSIRSFIISRQRNSAKVIYSASREKARHESPGRGYEKLFYYAYTGAIRVLTGRSKTGTDKTTTIPSSTTTTTRQKLKGNACPRRRFTPG